MLNTIIGIVLILAVLGITIFTIYATLKVGIELINLISNYFWGFELF